MQAFSEQSPMNFSKRIDLHCHSRASTEADEAMLQAIRCPESFSEPRDIYDQAKRRGMDFVTITDHDSIAGVTEIAGVANVLVGEEVTCYFPEDRCKIHLLTWGITSEDHAEMQRSAHDIYSLAAYVAEHRIAHAAAHPLYRQNGILDRRHIERLLLLFNGFECLNGAHSMTHREVFEPLLEELDVAEIRRLERLHRIDAIWSKPWLKTRTGGSDDHGLFNIGRTWTGFPDDTQTTDQLLECLRDGRCRPGGEAGSSVKLAHNFFGVGMRYYTRQVAKSEGDSTIMIRRMLGEAPPPGRIASTAMACRLGARALPRKVGRFLGIIKPARGSRLLGELLIASALKRGRGSNPLTRALKEGRAPLAEHDSMFDLICRIDRDVTSGIFDAVAAAIGEGQIGAVIDVISTVITQQALLLPYHFALFHQNQERDLLNRLSKRGRTGSGDAPRVGVFTDSINENDSAGRLVGDFGRFAELRGLPVTILAASSRPSPTKYWRNFVPAINTKLAAFPGGLKIPPVLEVMEWSDRKQFDVILVNTVGPMGLCGWLASQMLRAPMIAISHDDLPAQMLEITGGDYRLTAALEKYIAWLYRGASFVLTSGQSAAKITGIRARPLPADDRVESVWDACVRAGRGQESQKETSPMEVIRA
jgi:hypothetical protein